MADQPAVQRAAARSTSQEGTGEECLASNVEALLAKIRKKYKEYGIKEKPFVIVKADAGTYGMGIMTVRDAEGPERPEPQAAQQDVASSRTARKCSDVIIQEGVPTFERINDAVAEPVVYMIDRYVVGGFYRVHAERGIDENLNAPGAQLRAAGLRREQRSCRSLAASRARARPTASTCTA